MKEYDFIRKYKYKNKDSRYDLFDVNSHGSITLNSKELKDAIRNKSISVNGLKLTADGRIIQVHKKDTNDDVIRAIIYVIRSLENLENEFHEKGSIFVETANILCRISKIETWQILTLTENCIRAVQQLVTEEPEKMCNWLEEYFSKTEAIIALRSQLVIERTYIVKKTQLYDMLITIRELSKGKDLYYVMQEVMRQISKTDMRAIFKGKDIGKRYINFLNNNIFKIEKNNKAIMGTVADAEKFQFKFVLHVNNPNLTNACYVVTFNTEDNNITKARIYLYKIITQQKITDDMIKTDVRGVRNCGEYACMDISDNYNPEDIAKEIATELNRLCRGMIAKYNILH